MKSTLFILLLALSSFAQAQVIEKDQRILWLGDSVTAKGTHIGLIDAYLLTQHTDLNITNLPCGLGSETTSGLSEPSHPFPRPNIHERVDRVIKKLDFDVAILCYGINDGIYYPFSETHFEAYQKGMTELIEKLQENGTKVIALTPIPFDASSVAAKRLRPQGAKEYGYNKAFNGYNEVMKRYSKWVMQESPADHKIEITNALTNVIAEKRKQEPNFKSGDGVHPNPEIYAKLAQIILSGIGFKDARLDQVPADKQKLALAKNSLLALAYREHVGHQRPGAPKETMPLKEALEKASALDQKIKN